MWNRQVNIYFFFLSMIFHHTIVCVIIRYIFANFRPGLDFIGILLFFCFKTIENNRKTMRTIKIVKDFLSWKLISWQNLSKYLKYFTFYNYFNYLPLYSDLTVKASSFEHRPSKNINNFKSWNDTIMKFRQNASNLWIWKWKRYVTTKTFDEKLLTIS